MGITRLNRLIAAGCLAMAAVFCVGTHTANAIVGDSMSAIVKGVGSHVDGSVLYTSAVKDDVYQAVTISADGSVLG